MQNGISEEVSHKTEEAENVQEESKSVSKQENIVDIEEATEAYDMGQEDKASDVKEDSVKKESPVHSQMEQEAYQEIYADILKHLREFAPSEIVAGKITEDHITEYLEYTSKERQQQFRERRERRIIHMLELFAALAAIVFIVKALSGNPAILVNILYIAGGLGALFIWKYERKKSGKDKET